LGRVTTSGARIVPASGIGQRVSALLERRSVRYALAFLVGTLFTVFWFHNLFLHLGNAVLYGPNDESYSIRFYWGAAHAGHNPFNFHRDILNGFPEGLPNPTAVEWANLIIPATIWGLHWLVGFTAAENIFLLGGFILSFFSIYALLDYFGLHPAAAAYGAYASTFTPWMFERAGAGHHGFMQLWVFVVEIVALLYMHRRRSLTSAALAGLSLALVFYANSYYGLLGSVLFGVFIVVDFVQQSSWHARLWAVTLLDISVAAAVIGFLPALIAWKGDRQAVASGVSNPVQDVQNGGATLASYLMPGTRNPFLGGITRHFYPRADFVWSENTLYIGWSLIALGLVGAVLVLRRDPETIRTPLLRFFLVCILITAPVAFIWSLKRETSVLGLQIPMPSYAISEATTFWRVFARFGVLVVIALAILAAVALNVALKRWRWGRLLVVLAFAAIIFEHAISFPSAFQLTPGPAWATWLSKQPYGSVANYPLPTDKPQALVLLAESYFDQTTTKQPNFMLFGSGYGETREDAIRILARYVTDPLTPGILRAEDVKYILLHDDVYRSEGETPPPVPPGFHLVKRLPGDVRALELDPSVQPTNLAEVLSQNAASIALVEGLPNPKLKTPDLPVAANGSRILRRTGTLQISWPSTALPLTSVSFLIHAHVTSGSATIELLDQDGNLVSQAAVGTADTLVSLGPATVSGSHATFVLRSTPETTMQLTSIQVQPLADITKSIRNIH
jgi:hypothetical protein